MLTPKIILKFEQVAEQTNGPVKRLIGFIQAKRMLGLFDVADLDANPRSARAGQVTADIIESITEDAVTFPFKTKGVLIGSSNYTPLERHRYELFFADTTVEGILDGGHNMLAIGTQILSRVLDPAALKKIKMWGDLKTAWAANRDAITEIKDELNFLVPVEVLVPTDQDDELLVDEFKSSLLKICAARNNNVELTADTKANQSGFYEVLRKSLPSLVAERIEWKTNDGGEVRVRDVVALAWIPLSLLDLPGSVKGVLPQTIYASKGECVRAFAELMGHEEVSKPQNGPTHELHNVAVGSALKVAGDMPELYDRIYLDFPEAYNSTGGHFGKLSIVKMYDPKKKSGDSGGKSGKYVRTQPRSHFTNLPSKFRYPDGFILPLVYGLKALMSVENGKVGWKVDPKRFLQRNLGHILAGYKLVLDMSQYDPQKVGKNDAAYKIAFSEFEKVLLQKGSN